jgi:hypothetical protein
MISFCRASCTVQRKTTDLKTADLKTMQVIACSGDRLFLTRANSAGGEGRLTGTSSPPTLNKLQAMML